LVFLLFGCTQAPTEGIQQDSNTTSSGQSDLNPPNELNVISIEDVSLHSVKGDCWTIVEGKVYDLSEYTSHPGGKNFLQYCGADATNAFSSRHSVRSSQMLEKFLIGIIN